MLHKCGAVIAGSLLLATGGCEKAARLKESKQVSEFMMAGEREVNAISHSRASAAGSPQRFIATRHKLEVIATESNLPKAWESVITYCGTIACTVVSSNLVTKVRDAAPF